MLEIVYLEPTKKKLIKDVLFALELGFQVIGVFLLATIVGLKLDEHFNSRPCWLLGLLFLAFVYVIKLLLGVGKNE